MLVGIGAGNSGLLSMGFMVYVYNACEDQEGVVVGFLLVPLHLHGSEAIDP